MPDEKQLSLFDRRTIAVVNQDVNLKNAEWSYSRHKRFEQCLRHYYYDYFGANKRSAQDEKLKQELHFLKKLHSRHTFAGKALHRIIQTFFSRAQQGEYWELKDMTNWATIMLKDSRERSKCFVEQKHYKNHKKYEPDMLMEYILEFENADMLYDETQEKMFIALDNFYNHSNYELFRINGCAQSALIEKRINELSTFQFKVDGQVDLAYENGGIITLVDWKLGFEDNIGEDSLQLATYALWAIEYFGCSSNDLNLYKAYLGAGEVKEFIADDYKLEQARAIIEQSAERLATYQLYGERAVSEPFTPCLQEDVCSNCPFQGICYDRS